MGPCVTNWYFTSWSKAVSETRVKEVSSRARDQADLSVWLSVLCAVWPRRAEERGGVPDQRRGQGGWRRRRLRWRKTCRDEGL